MTKQMITILGPTACGKTALAACLAAELDGEIIGADSRQVYCDMDIGTGKDLADYTVKGIQIPYHLIDICKPGTKYNLFLYQEDFIRAYEDIMSRGKLPILCGGSGLYIEAVLKGYNLSPVPQNKVLREALADRSLTELTDLLVQLKLQTGSVMHNKTDVDSCQRAIRAIEIETYLLDHPMDRRELPAVNSFVVGLDVDREMRRKKISQRLSERLDNGLVAEVQGLLDHGIAPEDLIYYGLEYKYVTEYLIGKLNYEEMVKRLEIAIHQFAKRQMTWFRGMERRGIHIHWLDTMLPMKEKISWIKNKIE